VGPPAQKTSAGRTQIFRAPSVEIKECFSAAPFRPISFSAPFDAQREAKKRPIASALQSAVDSISFGSIQFGLNSVAVLRSFLA
jgi:hypothetical protein